MSRRGKLPAPLVPASANLRDFPFTPMFRERLFKSSFNAKRTDSEWRAGVTLWLKSWDQLPAGSLPNDDFELCQLAELGRDQVTWKQIRGGALHGWFLCRDGRFYHKVVAEGVLRALGEKTKGAWKREVERIKKHNQRSGEKLQIPGFVEWTSRGTPVHVLWDVPRDMVGVSSGTSRGCPPGRPQGNSEKEEREETEEVRSESSSPELNVSGLPLLGQTITKTQIRSRRRDATSLVRALVEHTAMPKEPLG